MNTKNEIMKALRGEPSSVTLYWDKQDSNSEGPAYRTADNGESGALDLIRWANINGTPATAEGRELWMYFEGPNDTYTGPDCYGVFPLLS